MKKMKDYEKNHQIIMQQMKQDVVVVDLIVLIVFDWI